METSIRVAIGIWTSQHPRERERGRISAETQRWRRLATLFTKRARLHVGGGARQSKLSPNSQLVCSNKCARSHRQVQVLAGPARQGDQVHVINQPSRVQPNGDDAIDDSNNNNNSRCAHNFVATADTMTRLEA